jgi:type II secretory pathway pseudopilin PulG
MNVRQQGFTLPELLVVGGTLMVLLIAAALLVSPRHDPAVLRDAQRRVDLAQLAQGINVYYAEHGELPPHIVEEEQFIGSGEGESDLCADLVPNYLEDLPFEPLGASVGIQEDLGSCNGPGSNYITVYAVQLTDNNTVTLAAPLTETGEEITLTRSYE